VGAVEEEGPMEAVVGQQRRGDMGGGAANQRRIVNGAVSLSGEKRSKNIDTCAMSYTVTS
jgi:hypothetical protein